LRAAPAEALQQRALAGFPGTVLFLPEEVRLCALAPEVGTATADAAAQLLPAPAAAAAAASASAAGAALTPLAARKALAAVAGARLVRVGIGLAAWPQLDAYPAANALVLKPPCGGARPNLAACRAHCLAGGFGGFAVDHRDGAAYFRTAAPAVLAAALAAAQAAAAAAAGGPLEASAPSHRAIAFAAPSTTFYVLTVRGGRVRGLFSSRPRRSEHFSFFYVFPF
jgi:hypothetical protein